MGRAEAYAMQTGHGNLFLMGWEMPWDMELS